MYFGHKLNQSDDNKYLQMVVDPKFRKADAVNLNLAVFLKKCEHKFVVNLISCLISKMHDRKSAKKSAVRMWYFFTLFCLIHIFFIY